MRARDLELKALLLPRKRSIATAANGEGTSAAKKSTSLSIARH